MNTHITVSGICHDVSKILDGQVRSVSKLYPVHRRREDTYGCLGSNQADSFNYKRIQYLTLAFSMVGESPPPLPRACFGRDELIETVVGLPEDLTPVGHIGAGGIGKRPSP